MIFAMFRTVALLILVPACISRPPECESKVENARLLIRLLSEGRGDDYMTERVYGALLELGGCIDLAYRDVLASEVKVERQFLLLKLGEDLVGRGVILDSSLHECLAIAIDSAASVEYLDQEVWSFASGLGAQILARRRKPVEASDLVPFVDRPNDPFVERVIQDVTVKANRLMKRQDWLDGQEAASQKTK